MSVSGWPRSALNVPLGKQHVALLGGPAQWVPLWLTCPFVTFGRLFSLAQPLGCLTCTWERPRCPPHRLPGAVKDRMPAELGKEVLHGPGHVGMVTPSQSL